ncbi:hypothetical protein C814_02371 [Anaerotruncus sp. G3(2012)]|nr:hypothetical protein C814_02371 [Anaerotruncus sp. G3(2012)]
MNQTMQPRRPEWVFFNESGVPISTFIPSAVGVVRVVGSTDEREAVRVRLRFKNGSDTETTVPLSDLNRVDWFKIDHRCLTNSEYRRARRYIADTIRAGVSNVPVERRYVLDRTGIYHIGDSIIFVAGNRVITQSSAPRTDPDFELGQLPLRLDIDENIDISTAIDRMMRLISLSPEIGPVLAAHTISGIIRAAFKKAGMTPCAVLVIVGKSGMLKSNYVPHLVQLYNRADGIGPTTRFNSTKRFIEDALYEYSECTAVLDDLHTAESRGIKRQNEDTAEEIIRRIADDTGRGRTDGKSLVQRSFRGNAVFIGEYSIGKASTIPRALIANITKPPNGAILDEYQRSQPLLVSTFYHHFIQWYVDHFDEIRDAIDARLTQLRRATASSTTHGRLRDTQFYLETSYMVLLEFCKDSGFCSEEDARDTYCSFSTQLHKLVQAQEARFRESVEVKAIDYLALIRDLYKKGYFRVAKDVQDFKPEKHDGLIYYGCLCLRGKCLEQKLKSIQSNLSLDACVSVLLSRDALKLVESKNTVQINGTGGKRFYAIKLSKLR